jgi:hypothetical protein
LNILLLGTITLSAASIDVPSHGFSQRPNDIYIWEVEISETQIDDLTYGNDGDKITIIITNVTISYTGICWYAYTLVGEIFFYNNTKDESQNLYGPAYLMQYNTTMGCKIPQGPFFVPHNESAAIFALNDYYSYGISFENYDWIAGPNGYDGIYSAWNGSSSGDLGELKIQWSYNERGETETYELYNGTGSDWELIFQLSIIFSLPYYLSDHTTTPSLIPGFTLAPIIIIFNIIVIILVIYRRNKLVENS